MLEMECHNHGILILCVQECRAGSSDFKEGVYYSMFVGSADSPGSGGCQIWVANGLCFRSKIAKHVSCRLSAVVGFSETIGRGISAVCGHAPTETSPAAVKDLFWDNLDSLSLELPLQFLG